VTTAGRPRDPLVRVGFLVVLLGGVVAMHTMGHPADHHHGDHHHSVNAPMSMNAGKVPHDPEPAEGDFDTVSICKAIRTAAVPLPALRNLQSGGAVGTSLSPPQPLLASTVGWGLPPPRTPSLAQLSVLRI
jgi:hypothetical protein